MRAVIVTEFGGPEVLRWQDVPDPEPGPSEVLIGVTAFAVNWADLLEREGRYPGVGPPPMQSGHDVTGIVKACGAAVDPSLIGTRVFGVLPTGGTAAEFVTCPASWVFAVPDGVDDVAAAGLAASYFTADAALVTMGRLVPNDTVLVHAAAGSTGSAAVQLARAYGARTIIATAGSAEKLQRVSEWGADVLVDYTADDFVAASLDATRGRGVDLVIESVGGDVLGSSFDCIAPGGRMVCVGASSGRSTNRFRLQTLFDKGITVGGFTLGLWIRNEPEMMAAIATRVLDAVNAGAVRPVTSAVYPPEEVAAAHTYLGDRRSIGRTVVSFQ